MNIYKTEPKRHSLWEGTAAPQYETDKYLCDKTWRPLFLWTCSNFNAMACRIVTSWTL